MRRTSSRPLTKMMTAAAVGVMAAAGMAAPASAAEAPRADRLSASAAFQTVTTWVQGNVRIGPSTGYRIAYTVAANQNLTAVCWTEGGTVTANGYTHNKWVYLADERWIWGGLLKGNEVGNVSSRCW
ncbi:SH3 domain-containing protein (plasmid) [Streptomyces sp. CA-294286]|uniref:SH3 domain-containing protein n=1 Tax=Streptomyces sp. CA-294286 TaxID=3240070 RepID=UPI003D8C7070